MRTPISLLTGLALLAVVTAAHAQRVPRERIIRTVAHAGQELRVQNYASWDRDCQPLAAPGIVLLRTPEHGQVTIRPGTATVSVLREGAADCTGHQYPGTTIWYTPTAGYVGPDQFVYDVISSRSTAHDTVVVDVRR